MGATFARSWRQAGVAAALALFASLSSAMEAESGPLPSADAGAASAAKPGRAAAPAPPSGPKAGGENGPVADASPGPRSQAQSAGGIQGGGPARGAETGSLHFRIADFHIQGGGPAKGAETGSLHFRIADFHIQGGGPARGAETCKRGEKKGNAAAKPGRAAAPAPPSGPKAGGENGPVADASPGPRSQAQSVGGIQDGGPARGAEAGKQGEKKGNEWLSVLAEIVAGIVLCLAALGSPAALYLLYKAVTVKENHLGVAADGKFLLAMALGGWWAAMVVILLGGIRPFVASSSAGVDAKDVLGLMSGGLSFILGLIAYVRWRDNEKFEASEEKLREELTRQFDDARKKLEENRREIEQEARERVSLAIAEMREAMFHLHDRPR